MIDIETLGLGPASVILSVGAVRFDPMHAPGVFTARDEAHADGSVSLVPDTFYTLVEPVEQQTRYGLQVEAGTAMWWLGDDVPAAARAEFLTKNKPGLEVMLAELAGWLALGGGTDVPIWSNGSMDINVLTTAYQVGGYGKPPWKYDAVRDYRTIAQEFGHHLQDNEWQDTKQHNALADACAQATNLQRIYRRIQTPHISA